MEDSSPVGVGRRTPVRFAYAESRGMISRGGGGLPASGRVGSCIAFGGQIAISRGHQYMQDKLANARNALTSAIVAFFPPSVVVIRRLCRGLRVDVNTGAHDDAAETSLT